MRHRPKPSSCIVSVTTTPLSVFLPVSPQPLQHCFSCPIIVENVYHFLPARGQIVVPPHSNLAVMSSCRCSPFWKSRDEPHPASLHRRPSSCSHQYCLRAKRCKILFWEEVSQWVKTRKVVKEAEYVYLLVVCEPDCLFGFN